MHRSTWKRGESRVAKLFATERTPLSGGNSKVTRSDTFHDKLFIESKHSKSHAVWSLYLKTRVLAKAEKKTPVVVLHKSNHAGVIFCVHHADMEIFIKEFIKANPHLFTTWMLASCHSSHPDYSPSQPSLLSSSPEKPKKRKRKMGKL